MGISSNVVVFYSLLCLFVCLFVCFVTRHQYGISALVSRTSFRGKPVGRRRAKCRLFSHANLESRNPNLMVLLFFLKKNYYTIVNKL